MEGTKKDSEMGSFHLGVTGSCQLGFLSLFRKLPADDF